MEASAQIRVGVTVGKRLARRSVQRSLVKRVLREALRHALPALAAAAGARQLDIVLRLKSAFPAPEVLALATFRRALRADAELVLQRLATDLGAAA